MQKVVNVTSVGATGEVVYAISWQQSTGYVLDYVDDTYKAPASLAADVDACYPLAEPTLLLLAVARLTQRFLAGRLPQAFLVTQSLKSRSKQAA